MPFTDKLQLFTSIYGASSLLYQTEAIKRQLACAVSHVEYDYWFILPLTNILFYEKATATSTNGTENFDAINFPSAEI